MNDEDDIKDKAIIIDLENRDISKSLYEAFQQAEIIERR